MYMYYVHMTYITTTMSHARNNFAEILDNASEQITVVKRRGKKDVAIFDVDILGDILSLEDKALITKIAKGRKSTERYSFDDVFGEL